MNREQPTAIARTVTLDLSAVAWEYWERRATAEGKALEAVLCARLEPFNRKVPKRGVKGHNLPADALEKLRAACDHAGESNLAEHLGVARSTIHRARTGKAIKPAYKAAALAAAILALKTEELPRKNSYWWHKKPIPGQ